MRALGWDVPPRASVLIAQLLELGRLHAVETQVRCVVKCWWMIND